MPVRSRITRHATCGTRDSSGTAFVDVVAVAKPEEPSRSLRLVPKPGLGQGFAQLAATGLLQLCIPVQAVAKESFAVSEIRRGLVPSQEIHVQPGAQNSRTRSVAVLCEG